MPKPDRFIYEKKAPFRDAFLFIIVCEGASREPGYFRFFDGMSSRVKVVPLQSVSSSAPNQLVQVALAAEQELSVDPAVDRLWFVIDTDRWGNHLHDIRHQCIQFAHWRVAQSNPCFEVWLYFHAKKQLPLMTNIGQCSNWKSHLPGVIQGGFNSDFHPIAIETATSNAKASYQAIGYFPGPGSSQLWELGEELIPLIKKELDVLRHKFPAPVVIG